MTAILIAAAVGMVVTLLGTPVLIGFLHKRQYGQFIRQDGPQGHFTKRGTPTMGGLVIIVATVLGYAVANLSELRAPRASGVLLLFLIVGLGLIGFLDDFEKISKQRSLGLTPWQKMLGQAFIGITFSVCGLFFADRNGLTPASTRISFARDSHLDLAFAGVGLGIVLFILWSNFLITAWSNAVNLTDGLDGLAAGSSAMVFGAYTLIGVWQTNQSCLYGHADVVVTTCYQVRDPRDLAMIAAALMGACFGFLWWNASPAKIFMGDTGSLALGGALAQLGDAPGGVAKVASDLQADQPTAVITVDREAAAQFALQNAAFRDQDTHLDHLSTSISRQHDLSLRMNEELELHAGLLTDLDRGVDDAETRGELRERRLERPFDGIVIDLLERRSLTESLRRCTTAKR